MGDSMKKVIGIICEYNPFHNGHLYHLNKIKEIFPDSIIVLVLSGSFTQRGIPSILTKWEKTEICLNYGVDLVIELPFPFATQSADIFAKGAIQILKECKVEYLVFGSESNFDYQNLIFQLKQQQTTYQKEVKQYLDSGNNYPTSTNLALEKLFGIRIDKPNDLLAFSYVKEIFHQDASIQPISISRTNDYHSTNFDDSTISSATSIRKHFIQDQKWQKYVPKETCLAMKNSIFLLENYFPFLKYKIESCDDLSIYQTVDEGIENRILKAIHEATSWEELVQKIKTKRYTYNKINRMLIHILCNFTKEKASRFQKIEYLRVLGFTESGKKYLNQIKKEVSIPLLTTFSKDFPMLQYELQVTSVYACILPEKKKEKYIQEEYQNKPKMKKS